MSESGSGSAMAAAKLTIVGFHRLSTALTANG
jgi:hypothetical protein